MLSQGWNRLSEARDEGAELSVMSVEFLALEDPEDQRAYVQENVNTPLERTTVISCLTTLFKKFDDPGSVSYLVLGTENKEVVILQQEANNIMTRIKVSCCFPLQPLLGVSLMAPSSFPPSLLHSCHRYPPALSVWASMMWNTAYSVYAAMARCTASAMGCCPPPCSNLNPPLLP